MDRILGRRKRERSAKSRPSRETPATLPESTEAWVRMGLPSGPCPEGRTSVCRQPAMETLLELLPQIERLGSREALRFSNE